MLKARTHLDKHGGFSLVELIIGSAVFALIAVSVYQSYTSLISLVSAARVKVTATDLVNEQFELIRNLSYSQVGISGGLPSGVLAQSETFVRDNGTFELTRTIRNIDDLFDGTIGGTPNDLSPADYKLVELSLSCPNCKNFPEFSVVGRVAPKNLETASTNGALFVRVFNGNGEPVSGANVHIVNSQATTTITIDDVTDNNGMLQIVDAPPGANAYKITISKTGYTTDMTEDATLENPNPSKPHATVALQQVTQISFVIDQISTARVSTITDNCSVVPSISFDMVGSKLIGTNPDVYKFDQTFTTDSSGQKTVSNLEWDTYNLALNSTTHYLAGVNPLLPVSILPGAVQNIDLILTVANPKHLLVTVKDSATSLPLSGVQVNLSGNGIDETLTTGLGFLGQSDWSGGGGQNNFVNETQYLTSDGNIGTSNPAGEIKLANTFGQYAVSGTLTSSTFDTGTTSNWNSLVWVPTAQPVETGSDNVLFQVSTAPTNDATTTWSYLGPDGTGGSFYDVSNQNISNVHNGDRYLRYKVFLNTASTTFSPNIADVSFTFTSSCIPPGQVIFSGLASGSYTLTLSKAGYATQIVPVNVSSNWQQQEVILAP
ncbi:MAG: hypothetical protein A2741_02505 [Candidatus Zambryskibacteria bacterium RIFCSPHIGHO2_01_FULL_43_27]|nr:MAG: hypothetical protein A2741_02505 [Candidatus Zambryskibacteria bacterium RIFCSPHIGHO2_01_FULL_43_27]OHB00050.1 MAG: hypothetical protein A3E93_02390 [Candidatus Zambryskibacteria bacterium RIFCSPHIGHO2_12_FULL_43_12b]